MHAVNLGGLFRSNRAATDIGVQFGIGQAHFAFVGLAFGKSGRRCLSNNGFRSVQEAEEFKNFRYRQVGNRVEIMGAVSPLGEVTDVGFTAVAGAGNQAAFIGSNGIQGGHPQTWRNVVQRSWLQFPGNFL